MKISTIIPIYNALDDVKKLLNSIMKNYNFHLGEILLINDSSNAETSLYLQKISQKISDFKLFQNEKNLGFIKTCNKGIKLAQNDIIVLLNSDTEIPPEFCERIIKCFKSSAKIGVASPISAHSTSYSIPLKKNYTLEKMNQRLRKKHKCTYPLIPSAEGYCFCIRKEVILKQGYLDEIYGKGYHEEVDFAYRAITNGWNNVLIDDLYVFHKRHASFGDKQREKLLKRNDVIFQKRWKNFKENYEKENNLTNPIFQIRYEVFPFKSLLERIFSMRNSYDKKYKIITVLGVSFKIKRKNFS